MTEAPEEALEEVLDFRPMAGSVDYTHAWGQVEADLMRRQAVDADEIPAPKICPKDQWPPNYGKVLAWRQLTLAKFELDERRYKDEVAAGKRGVKPSLLAQAKGYYKDHPVDFINHWCDTYDPRNLAVGKPAKFPFILFPRQAELVEFVLDCVKGQTNGLVEKSRDMGASWVCIALTVWYWLFHPASAIGWGSNHQDKVDKIGVADSLFEKIRMLIEGLPKIFWPATLDSDKHLFFMRCINPETGATISGEIGDNIGRGGRTLIYFVDEAAHLNRPEKVEASLADTTRVRIDISSVSGTGSVYHRKREAGKDWVSGQPVATDAVNVFVMDWSDHPEKTQEWYDRRKRRDTNAGLAHVFAQEVDRDYSAAQEGIIIPAEYVRAAIDAHLKLGFDDEGGAVAGLDVADAGVDRNACAIRKGSVLKRLEEWSERDTGLTARRAVSLCALWTPIELQYDSIGVGAGVKAESNRLRDEGLLPEGLTLAPWAGSAKVLNPSGRILKDEYGNDDESSPRNKDYYFNLKAQAWWMLRQRFYNTWRAIEALEGREVSMTAASYTWDPGELISLPSADLPLLRKLQKELSQAIAVRNTQMKLVVDKTPEGTQSPNLADAVVMAFWPGQAVATPMVGTFGPIVIRAS